MSLSVSLVQTAVVWQNAEANRLHIEELLWEMEENTDLIVLPELFSTGFTFSRKLAEPHNLHTFKWMKQMAQLKNACVMGSFLVSENGMLFNRCYFVYPNGDFKTYDKRHLFPLSEEKNFCQAGNKQAVFTINDWKITPSICYDLRFPVWLRNTKDYDVLVNIANWPSVRKDTWQTLLQARAIENQCFSIGVNRTGTDGNDLSYEGESSIYSPTGDTLVKIGNTEKITTFILHKSDLTKTQTDFPFLADKDDFSLS